MEWQVLFYEEFEPEFDVLPVSVADELFAHAKLLKEFGPHLGRPHADTLNDSHHANIKELRFDASGGGQKICCSSGGFEEERNQIMTKALDQKFNELGPARRKKIEARAAELIAEELSLRELRQAHRKTQKHMTENSASVRKAFRAWSNVATCSYPLCAVT